MQAPCMLACSCIAKGPNHDRTLEVHAMHPAGMISDIVCTKCKVKLTASCHLRTIIIIAS